MGLFPDHVDRVTAILISLELCRKGDLYRLELAAKKKKKPPRRVIRKPVKETGNQPAPPESSPYPCPDTLKSA